MLSIEKILDIMLSGRYVSEYDISPEAMQHLKEFYDLKGHVRYTKFKEKGYEVRWTIN